MKVASLSGGKESVAMLLLGNYDQAVFYDTGKEFFCTYKVIEKMKEQCEVITLHPRYSFDYKMFDICRVRGKNKGKCGYRWCGGRCRWGTNDK